MEIISGKSIAQNLLETNLIPRVKKLKEKNIFPKLVVILVGENPASQSYIRQKEKFAEKSGILSEVRQFESHISELEILNEIKKINQDSTVHGLIVQLPLPENISIKKVIETIDPQKDVDGFSALNIGYLFQGQKTLECCTPKGIIRMLEASGEILEGKKVTVIGRSNNVGKPVSILALNKNATVQICHSRTKNLTQQIQDADILIVAVGKPEFLHGDQIPQGCVVIDVGIHRTESGKLCGDVHFESAKKKVSKISPVPGGVGPMTVYALIENTIEAAENQEFHTESLQ